MRRKELCEMRENNNTNDRLSELPDAILTHILSFLDTKYAVRTSSLSKRWINLWIPVTNLNFHSSSFRKLTTFQHFINHVLTRRDNSISLNRFVFNCKRTITFKCFENVINYATSNGVKHLEVWISRRRFYSIPSCTFSAVSLRTLKLKATGHCRVIETRFCFEQLQTLSLDGFMFEGSDLFSKCPNLVELSIVDCDVHYPKKLIISAPQLERLNISFRLFSSEISEIVLSLPKLSVFNFKAPEPVVLQTDELVCLKNVTIDLGSFYAWHIEKHKKYSRTAMNMLQQLHNGEYVTLSMPTIELLYVITGLEENPPLPFDNLKSLTIIAESLEQPLHKRKYPSKLIEPNKRISLNVLNQVMNYLLLNAPQAEMVFELPRYCAEISKFLGRHKTPNPLEEKQIFWPKQAS